MVQSSAPWTWQPSIADADGSTRSRILVATAEVIGRNGVTKLSLSDVAAQAGVSRPTLYRWFASKEDLVDAFGLWERRTYECGLARAIADLPRRDKLDGALRFIVEFQQSYPGLRMVDIEPGRFIDRSAHVLPTIRSQLQRLIPGPTAAVAAATAVRVAVSHYLVRSDDGDDFLAQLRHAVGLTRPQ